MSQTETSMSQSVSCMMILMHMCTLSNRLVQSVAESLVLALPPTLRRFMYGAEEAGHR